MLASTARAIAIAISSDPDESRLVGGRAFLRLPSKTHEFSVPSRRAGRAGKGEPPGHSGSRWGGVMLALQGSVHMVKRPAAVVNADILRVCLSRVTLRRIFPPRRASRDDGAP